MIKIIVPSSLKRGFKKWIKHTSISFLILLTSCQNNDNQLKAKQVQNKLFFSSVLNTNSGIDDSKMSKLLVSITSNFTQYVNSMSFFKFKLNIFDHLHSTTNNFVEDKSIGKSKEKVHKQIEVDFDESLKGVFNLEDFQIETSWLSGEKSRKTDSFPATKIDDKPWYNKEGGSYILKSLRTDGNRTEWKEIPGKQASLKTYKNLQYVAQVENIPENGLTVAQVHNRGGVKRPLLRVYIDKDRYIKIKVTVTNPTQASSSYDKIKGPYYKEGSKFKVDVVTIKGKISVKVKTTSGVMDEIITPSRDWKPFSDSYYLKAGVYTEGDDIGPQSTFDYFLFKRQS